MNINDIPFANHLKISEDGCLENNPQLQNHLQSLHAGAIYTLAETASGMHLLKTFPDLQNEVIALLRESSIKYKSQAYSKIKAYAFIEQSDKEIFYQKLQQKRFSMIRIKVDVKDQEKQTIAIATFTWFVSYK